MGGKELRGGVVERGFQLRDLRRPALYRDAGPLAFVNRLHQLVVRDAPKVRPREPLRAAGTGEVAMKKVLVIEDNKDNMRLISYSLRHAGYQVVPAETGEEGVALAISEKPFFIIMDINLPGIDGLEASRRIRASESNGGIPIVAITSFAMLMFCR